MSRKENMPTERKKCLVEEYDKALQSMSNKVGFSDDAVILGKSSEFDKKELINFHGDRKINIMVDDGMIYMLPAASKIHEKTAGLFFNVSKKH